MTNIKSKLNLTNQFFKNKNKKKVVPYSYSRIIGYMCMASLDLTPTTKMEGAAMEHVHILRGEEVDHEEHEGRYPHQADVLANPPGVIVHRVLMKQGMPLVLII